MPSRSTSTNVSSSHTFAIVILLALLLQLVSSDTSTGNAGCLSTTKRRGPDTADDATATIPWEESRVQGRQLTIVFGGMVVLLIALRVVRQVGFAKGLDNEEMKRYESVYNSAKSAVSNIVSLCLQIMVLFNIFQPSRSPRPTGRDVDFYYVALIISMNAFIVESVMRRDLDNANWMHHTLALTVFTLIMTQVKCDSTTFSPIFSDPNGWVAIVHLGAGLGLFESSSFAINIAMILYHLYKRTKPVLVYKALTVGLALNIFARVGVWTVYWVIYSRDNALLTMAVRVLLAVSAAIFICIEIQCQWIVYIIRKKHYAKRVRIKTGVLPLAKSGEETSSIHSNAEEPSSAFSV